MFGAVSIGCWPRSSHGFTLWADDMRSRLERERIAVPAADCFAFARTHTNLWTGIYDHRLLPGETLSEAGGLKRGAPTGIALPEIAGAVGLSAPGAPSHPLVDCDRAWPLFAGDDGRVRVDG